MPLLVESGIVDVDGNVGGLDREGGLEDRVRKVRPVEGLD